jgi:hypothetical protein
MGFTFTHATLKLLTAGAIASWFSFGMRLLKSSVGTTRTTQLIGHAISKHVRTYEWPVADTQRIYLSAEIRGRIAIPVVLVILGAGVARVSQGNLVLALHPLIDRIDWCRTAGAISSRALEPSGRG